MGQKIWSWPVVGVVLSLTLGAGLAFMTSGHDRLADSSFLVSAVLFLAKFMTWDDAKRQAPFKKWRAFGVAAVVSLAVLAVLVAANHWINPRDLPAPFFPLPKRSTGSEAAPTKVITPESQQKARSQRPLGAKRAEIGLAVVSVGARPSAPELYFYGCAVAGLTCMREEDVAGNLIDLPIDRLNRAEIAMMISVYGMDLEDFHATIACRQPGVSLDYQGQRQISPHSFLEFTGSVLESVTSNQKPSGYLVDIHLDSAVESFPVSMEVWGRRLAAHAVSTTLRVVR